MVTLNYINQIMSDCAICPRKCHSNRLSGNTNGSCGQSAVISAARAALHFWEEPCISGTCGSGAVFFSGCNMGCIFCQNYEIAHGQIARPVSLERLSDIFLELQDQNASNINLVTPTHFVPQIAYSLELAKDHGLCIPIVYNTGGYENVETLRMLDGLIDIYLPDFKYYSNSLSTLFSGANNYFAYCSNALSEMVRQTGVPSFFLPGVQPNTAHNTKETMNASEYNDYIETLSDSDDTDKVQDYCGPLMKKGVIVRHMLLPGCIDDSRKIVKYLLSHFGSNIYISIMNQYTPMKNLPERIHPLIHAGQLASSDRTYFHNEINSPSEQALSKLLEKVPGKDYDALIDYAISNGIENGFIQGSDTASDSFIPAFDFKGL